MKLPRIRPPFALKIGASAAVLSLAAVSLFAYLSFRQHSEHLIEIVREELAATVRNTAPLFASVPLEPDSTAAREAATDELERLLARNPKPEVFRLFAVRDGKPVLAAAAGRGGPAAAPQRHETGAALAEALLECIEKQHPCATPLYKGEKGRWISAVAPITDDRGRLVGVLAADREAAEYEHALHSAVREMLLYSAAALAASVFLGVFLSRRVARPLRRLYRASQAARAGRFEPVETSGDDEVAVLTRDFNETHETLLEKMAELEALARELEERVRERTGELQQSYEELHSRQEIIRREMTIARHIQETIVPKGLETDRIEVEVEYLPISGLGGDWGIVSRRKAGILDVAIGDVTGHGVGAALVVNRVYTLLSQLCAAEASLDGLLHQLDYFLAEELSGIGIYMTFMICRFDLEAMRLQFAGAGHPPVIVYRQGAQPVLLDSHCGILGVGELFCDLPAVREFELESGDFLVLYTDGLMEAINAENEQFGLQRLQETVIRAVSEGCDAKNMLSCITEEVKKFTGGYLQDDVLLMTARVR